MHALDVDRILHGLEAGSSVVPPPLLNKDVPLNSVPRTTSPVDRSRD